MLTKTENLKITLSFQTDPSQLVPFNNKDT